MFLKELGEDTALTPGYIGQESIKAPFLPGPGLSECVLSLLPHTQRPDI